MSIKSIMYQDKNGKPKISIAVMLILTLAFSIFAVSGIQLVSASDTAKTYCFVAPTPNPVGVNQKVQVSFWLANSPPTAGVASGDRWQGLTLTITKPDGTIETKGPYTSDPIGGYSLSYTPTTTGTYKFQMHFPGQHIVGMGGLFVPIPIDIQYQACDSAIVSLVVQQEPVSSVSIPPLPTAYWTHPINAQNEAWSSASSNWLMAGWDWSRGSFDQGSCNAPYNYPPQSAHVLWTKPMTFGGLLGGEFGTASYYNGMSYEQFFKPPVIISGRLYYQTITAEEAQASSAYGGVAVGFGSVTCVDMTNGQTLFIIPNMTLAFGQVYNYVSPNQAGGFAYLWDTSGSAWKMYDAWTGQYILSINNVPSGTTMLSNTYGGAGDIMVYSLNAATQKLTLWNSSLVFQNAMINLGFMGNVWMWRPYFWAGQTLNGSLGIQWTKTLQDMPAGGSIFQVQPDNTVYINNGTAEIAAFAFPTLSTWCGYSMTDGNKLWGPNTIDLRTKAPPNSTGFAFSFEAPPIGAGGILPIFVRETLQSYAWDVKTGQFMWGPTTAYSNAWSMYNWELEYIVNGRYYNPGYDGKIHVFNASTGAELWTFYSGDAGTTTPYGTWPFYNGLTMAGDTVIGTTGEHGNGVMPLYEGEKIYVLDQATGKQIWNMTGWFEQPAIADGMMVSHNNYDNQIFCFGKGPSATTVDAPMTALTQGTSVVIRGTVTDQSVGAKGTPAIADDYQGDWMNYLYEQQPKPTNAKGVIVHLTAIDPNGNYQDIGNVTSDNLGNFALAWTPPVAGLYIVKATFDGSKSYYGSEAGTSFMVSAKASAEPVITPAPTQTTAPTSTPPVQPVSPSPTQAVQPPASGMPLITYVAIGAAAIIIVAVAAALILRKRK